MKSRILLLILIVCFSAPFTASASYFSGGGGATTEAQLEADLTDVTDVFTNNDGALDDDDVTDDNVESMATAGAVGLAPLSDGASGLTMTDVWTEAENTTAAYLSAETDPNALLSGGTDNVKDTHVDWGAGVGQVDLDDVPDSATYGKTTVTQVGYIDQDVGSGSSPTLDGTNFSGIPAAALPDAAADGATKGVSTFNATRFSAALGVVDIASVAGLTGANEDDVTNDNVESMATAGAVGLAPLSDGASGLTMTDILTEVELDTFSELNTQIADKTLVNEEDAVEWDSVHSFMSSVLLNKVASSSVGGATQVMQQFGTNSGLASFVTGAASATGPILTMAKTRGTVYNDYTIVADNDVLGQLQFYGADGTDLETPGARIYVRVNGTPGANDMPAELIFATTADGESTTTDRMRIEQNGKVSVVGDLTAGTWSDFDTFSEINAIVADKTLVNEEDAITLDSLLTVNANTELYGQLQAYAPDGTALLVQNQTNAASNEVAVFRGGNRTSAANNDEAYISFYLDDDTEVQAEFGRITWIATDVQTASQNAAVEFELMVDDVSTVGLTLTGSSAVFAGTVRGAFVSSDASVGVTGASCSSFKDGICVAT